MSPTTKGTTMAKKLTTHEEVSSDQITPAELRRVVDEANRQKNHAADYTAAQNQVIKGAIERYGLDRAAFSLARRLDKMEPAKRQGQIRALVSYLHMLGHFREVDMFDDLVGVMEAILEEARALKPAADGDGARVVKAMVA